MEVHKHPHHVLHKKNWTEYVLEFLMIFLAVTLGFFAENIRERVSDFEKQNQYIESLCEDLEVDTTRISSIILYDKDKIDVLDKMRACYGIVSRNLACTACMGPLIKFSKSNRSFTANDRTLSQLANAGGYRLLRKEDADSILSYQSFYRQYEDFQATLFQEAQNNIRNTLNRLADFKVNEPFQTVVSTIGSDSTPAVLQGPLLFSNDRALLNKWFNELAIYRRVTFGQINQLQILKRRAIDLLKFYKAKHKLD